MRPPVLISLLEYAGAPFEMPPFWMTAFTGETVVFGNDARAVLGL
jgi:hypothetical protein